MAVLRADPEYRKKVFFVCVLAFILGFAAINWGLPEFDEYLKQKKPGDAFRIVLLILRVVFLSILPWTIYFIYYGLRILKTGRYPLPGAKVIRDTEIIEGKPARRKACVIIAGSFLVTALALFGALYFPNKLDKVFDVKNMNQESNESLKKGAEKHRAP